MKALADRSRALLQGVRRGCNTLLPPGIAVTSAEEVGDDFHPRFSENIL